MREFNLLPWRSELREKRKRDYLISLGICAVAALLIVAFIHWIYFLKLQNQNEKNDYLFYLFGIKKNHYCHEAERV